MQQHERIIKADNNNTCRIKLGYDAQELQSDSIKWSGEQILQTDLRNLECIKKRTYDVTERIGKGT